MILSQGPSAAANQPIAGSVGYDPTNKELDLV